jgi:urease accessory protein
LVAEQAQDEINGLENRMMIETGMIPFVFLHTFGGGGLLAGFLHPLLGLEHLLAMLAVGLLSAQIGGRALWTVPATFVAVMGISAVLGIVGLPLPFVQYGLTISVFILGLAILLGSRVPEWAALIVVGIFAFFHGHAHGTQLPEVTDTISLLLAYIFGFLVATVGLHVVGALIGLIFGRLQRGQLLMRIGGLAIALIGVLLTINV